MTKGHDTASDKMPALEEPTASCDDKEEVAVEDSKQIDTVTWSLYPSLFPSLSVQYVPVLVIIVCNNWQLVDSSTPW